MSCRQPVAFSLTTGVFARTCGRRNVWGMPRRHPPRDRSGRGPARRDDDRALEQSAAYEQRQRAICSSKDRYASEAESRGLEVLIAGAGGAAHLPGMLASMTLLPVLGVPVESRVLRGVDSLLSIVQMPKGIPVGTLAIGSAGAANAGLLAAAILARGDAKIREALERFRREQTEADFRRARELIIGSGALDATLDLAADYADKAKAALAAFPANDWREALEDLADFAQKRLQFFQR